MKRALHVPLAGTALALAILAGAGPVATSHQPAHACCQDGQPSAAVPAVNGVVNTQNVHYGTDPTQKLDIYRPPTAGESTRYPTIIIVHGGGWSMFDQAGNRCLATYFVERGNYVVFNIDYRKLDNSTVYLNDIIEDVFGAILWVKDNAAKYGGNPDMIGITGDSAGGHLAAIATLAADRVSATGGFAAGRFTFKPVYVGTRTRLSPSDVAVRACASNFGVMTIPTDMTVVSLRDYKSRLNMLAPPVNTAEHYAACSPMSNIANKGVPKVPFLDAGGSADTVVPPPTIDAFHAALVSAGYPATRINYPGLPHAYLNCGRNGIGPDAAKAADDMLAFWKQHLVQAAPKR
jgi:acetyl esterase